MSKAISVFVGTALVIAALLLLVLLSPLILYYRLKRESKAQADPKNKNICRFAKGCKHYKDVPTCNNDRQAITYCGIAKKFMKHESRIKEWFSPRS